MIPADGIRRSVTILLVLILLALASAPPATGAPDDYRQSTVAVDSEYVSPAPFVLQTTPENNTTVHHTNPDAVSKPGNLKQVRGWLAGHMGEVLVDCTEGLRIGNYNACDRIDKGQYPEWLEKYVDVTRETDSEDDDDTGEEFEESQNKQREYAKDVREFNETYREYREARQEGNSTRARRLARRLLQRSEEINETGSELVRSYRFLTNNTEADLTQAAQNVEAITRNVTELADRIEEEQFVETVLTASARSERISFLDPLVVTGRLTTENGTPIAGGMIVARIGGETIRTRTNATGEFSIQHRPTLLPLDTGRVVLQYVPGVTSVYIGSNASVSVTVVQVQPAIGITEHTETAGFDDRVRVSGTVAADDIGARDVPVVVSVGGHRLGTTRTDADGSFAFATRLPAGVLDGEREIRVELPLNGQALAQTNATASLAVVRTETSLTVEGEQTDGRSVRVTGTLRTTDGTPVGDQSVLLRVNGQRIGTTTTGSDGRYTTTVTVPEAFAPAPGENGTVTLNATFDGSGTNLEGSSAETEVELAITSRPDEQPNRDQELQVSIGDQELQVSIWGLIILLITLFAIAAGGYSIRRELWPARGDADAPIDKSVDADVAAEETDEEPEPLLALARDRLAGGNADEAVQIGYETLRQRLGEALGITAPQTHWEFYQACREAGLEDDRLDALRRVTELYERAAFAAESLSVQRARAAINEAQTIGEYIGGSDESEATNP